MSLEQLHVLVVVAEVGSFSAAGRKLRRAQSAISASIATLEASQGVKLFDRTGYRPRLTDVGRVLVHQARQVLASARRFEAVAANSRAGVEAELTVAIDPLVPSAPLISSLRALSDAFPHLPLTFSTEGLGGALRRLREESAALAIGLLLPAVPEDTIAHPLFRVALTPVVAADHPLARLGRPATADDLAPYVQLVLADPIGPRSPSYGVASERRWRFVDLSRRLDFLEAGFGWCRMPHHVVAGGLNEGRLVAFEVEDDPTPAEGVPIYAAHLRSRTLGAAGRWLLEQLLPGG